MSRESSFAPVSGFLRFMFMLVVVRTAPAKGRKKQAKRQIAPGDSFAHVKPRKPHRGSVLTPPGFRANPTGVPCNYPTGVPCNLSVKWASKGKKG